MKGRGIDFKHRFKTSRWAEDLLLKSLGEQYGLLAVRFGLSEVRKSEELIYGKTVYKEPDLLLYQLTSLRDEEVRLLEQTDLVTVERERFDLGGDMRFS